MRLLVTAGNTQVPIDRVRCITNIFTGRTGRGIALEAYRRGHQVTLATSNPEKIPEEALDPRRWRCEPYRTFEELDRLMARHIAESRQDAVVHCAAVSDYLCAGVFAPAPTTHFQPSDGNWRDAQNSPTLLDRGAAKVKSDDPELWLRMVRAPKLVDKIRKEWNYRGVLVKFKLEVGSTEQELRTIAERSRQLSEADWMVANTLEGMADWALLGNAEGYRKVAARDLPAALLDVIEKRPEESHHG